MKKILWPKEWCSTCTHPTTENSANWSINSQESWKNSGHLTPYEDDSGKNLKNLKYADEINDVKTLRLARGRHRPWLQSSVTMRSKVQTGIRSSSDEKVPLQRGHVDFIRTTMAPTTYRFPDQRVSTNFNVPEASSSYLSTWWTVTDTERRYIVELLNEHWCFA